MWLVDTATLLVVETNEALAQRLGIARDKLPGSPIANFAAALEGSSDEWTSGIRSMRVRARDGTHRIESVLVQTLAWDQGPTALVTVIEPGAAERPPEESIGETEERARDLSAISSEWSWEQDEELRFTWMSDNIERIVDLPLQELAIGRTRWELADFAVEPTQLDEHKRVLARHEPFSDLVVRQQGGRGLVFSVSGTPIFDEEGTFRGYRGVSRDVTRLQRTEDALRQSDTLVRLAVEHTGIGIWTRELPGEYTEWSENVGPMFGQPAGTPGCTVQQLFDWVHQDDIEAFLANRAGWPDTKDDYEVEHRVAVSDGSLRWIFHRGHLLRSGDGTPLRTIGVTQDITARKLTETALRESTERFRLLADNIRDIFWIADRALRRFEYISPSYEEIFGEPREIVYHDPRHWREFVVADDRDLVVDMLRQLKLGLPAQMEFRIARADGQVRWLHVRSFPIVDAKGNPGACGVTEDITERKRADERRFEVVVQQRDALIREVHHRIKNNLQGVVGLLRRHALRDPELLPSIDAAIAKVQSMAIVHGLQGREACERVGLGDILSAICRMLEGLAGVHIQLSEATHQMHAARVVEGEAVSVALILNELVQNAVKHAIAAPPVRTIRATLTYEDGAARVSIYNPGRLPTGFDFPRTGLGTGLQLAHALLPAHGVELTFHQRERKVETRLTLSAPAVSFEALSHELA